MNLFAALISFLAIGNKDFSVRIRGSKSEQRWYCLVAKNSAILLELFWFELASNSTIHRRST